MNIKLTLLLFVITFFIACSPAKQIAKSARENVLEDSSLRTAHVGISVYEPATGKYWYNYQGDKYFVPASNAKLPTCYAAMKYLGDSIVGLEYAVDDKFLLFKGTGDPTLLHSDFRKQPTLNFLKNEKRNLAITPANFTDNRWGAGWGIGDVTASYAPERNEIPVYGNILTISKKGDSIVTIPSLYRKQVQMSKPSDWRITFERTSLNENIFQSRRSNQVFTPEEIPFVTANYMSALKLLEDTLKKEIAVTDISEHSILKWTKLYSQPTDSLLKITMHRSDNFFAEQTLLMVSNELLGVMNDAKIIDTLLKTDFKDLPQKPHWVDGSGLSRYDLFTPQDFVTILNKMRNEFGMDRIKNILATGNTGTLNNFYKKESGYIFAKTGTLSGVVAISGFLYTKKNKLLIFSVLINNHQSPSSTPIRRAVEKFIEGLRENY